MIELRRNNGYLIMVKLHQRDTQGLCHQCVRLYYKLSQLLIAVELSLRTEMVLELENFNNQVVKVKEFKILTLISENSFFLNKFVLL